MLAAVLAEYPAAGGAGPRPRASDGPAAGPTAQLRAVAAAVIGRSSADRGVASRPGPRTSTTPTARMTPADDGGAARPGPAGPGQAASRGRGRRPGGGADCVAEAIRSARDDPSGAPPLPPWTGSGPATESQLATLLYAVNLVRWFRLDEHVESPSTGWAVVEAVGRNLLRGLPVPRRRELLSRPAALRARRSRRPAGRRPYAGAARRRDATGATAGWPSNDVPATVFAQPGRVLVSHTHVDVVMDLETVDLAARVSGLDQDPGWVPSLGRIVLFHFEGH